MSLLDEHVVVLITGISAAGKSTIADLLARRFARGVHVRGDAFRRMVVAGREEMAAPASDEAWRQLRLRYRLGAMVADAYHDAGFAVVVQDVVLGPVLAEYVESIRSRPLVVVVLAPRPEVILRREAERGKAAYGQGSHSVADLDRALRAETPRIGMWIDTSEQTPEHTVDDIVARGLALGRVA
ncbi:MAG: AAA family ATPase [Acidimicrobiales bacterium]